nr:MAG TPA: hypothetical protein [Caudoviricetes sp.]
MKDFRKEELNMKDLLGALKMLLGFKLLDWLFHIK